MTLRGWILFASLCASVPLQASSLAVLHPDDMLENPWYESPNGRYILVVREYPVIGDFESKRLDTVVDFDSEDGFSLPSDGDAESEMAAMYDDRQLISVMKISQGYRRRSLFVTDSGRIILACLDGSTLADQPLLTIYDAHGSLIRSLRATDVFTATDVALLVRGRCDIDVSVEDELVVISLAKHASMRVRAENGEILDPRRDLLPIARAYATPANEPAKRAQFEPSPDDACFEGVARIASRQLVARAVEDPLPEFPVVADKARIRGRVWVEVVVSATGDVLCARATQMPFGVSKSAVAAARQWKFEPYELDGRATPVTSELLFHFVDVAPRDWEEITAARRGRARE